jgi:hypothetical protein
MSEELDPRIEFEADRLFGGSDDQEQEQQEDTSEIQPEQEQDQEQEETKLEVSQPPVVDETSRAKKHGYLSEEEYKAKHGSLEGFKSPEQFNKYGEAWNEVSTVIKNMQKQLSERDKAIESLVKYNERVEERAAQRARQELEQQLADAKRVGDVQAVEELTKEKAKLEFHTYQSVAQQAEQERQTVFQSFVERNKHWYGINPEMTNRAAEIDSEEMRKAHAAGINLNYQQLGNIVEARMRVEYPDVMISRSTGNNAPTISVSQSSVNKSVNTSISDSADKIFNKLTSDQQVIFNIQNRALKRMGQREYTKKEFIEKLKKQGEI